MVEVKGITKENFIPLASIVATLGTAFAIWTGVINLGTDKGSMTEKISNIEKTIERQQDALNRINSDVILRSSELSTLKIENALLKEQVSELKLRVKDVETDMRSTRVQTK